jgi:hypothetical protein
MSQTRPSRKERRAKAEAEKHPSTERIEVEDIDEILAGVDAILEENELEVTRTFRQRGGE